MRPIPRTVLFVLLGVLATAVSCSPLSTPVAPLASSTPSAAATGIGNFVTIGGTQYPRPVLFPSPIPNSTYAPLRGWEDVLEFTPFAYSTSLPPDEGTPLDGTYAKFDPSEPQWYKCIRCADFRPAGGVWRMRLDRGVMLFFYEVTGFASVSSYTVQGDHVYFYNDPHCPYETGEYTWVLGDGALQFEEVQDTCALDLRALNLTRQPWLSCPEAEDAAAGTPVPEGCP